MFRNSRLLLFVLAMPFLASAQQALTGTITGALTDPSDAGIPDGQVTARNVETGLERTVMSGEFCIYTITLRPIGEYNVTAKKAGFGDLMVGPVRVGVGQSVSLELRM